MVVAGTGEVQPTGMRWGEPAMLAVVAGLPTVGLHSTTMPFDPWANPVPATTTWEAAVRWAWGVTVTDWPAAPAPEAASVPPMRPAPTRNRITPVVVTDVREIRLRHGVPVLLTDPPF